MNPTINLAITVNTPETAVALIRALFGGGAAQPSDTDLPAHAPPAVPQVFAAPVAAVAPIVSVMPVADPAPVSIAPVPVPATSPGVPVSAPQYTLQQLAVAAQQLMDAGKQSQLIGLLAQFGVPSMPQLPKEQYGAFATALRGLGARI